MDPWIIFPLIGGLIGYLTNYMAVKMIFRPRKPICGIQGLIPRRRSDLAQKIGETVSSHLFTHEDLANQFPTEKLELMFAELVGGKVDDFIDQKFVAINPMIAAFLSDDLRQKIRDKIVEKMQELLPDVKEKLIAGIDDIDMSDVITKKIEGFDVMKLESIILSICRHELRAIEILGGVLGAIIGLIQCYLLSQGYISF